jgi:cysteinyl-tRNA synthetase
VTLRLFDTVSRAVREFQPVVPGEASVYLCGPTAAGGPHVGHLRSAVCFDILVRWLEATGLRVTYCRNVTDVDDKILAAAAEGPPWWVLSERNQREFSRAYDLLGCRPPDAEPRATGHIPDIAALIERLLAGGHAYQAGGDVYFDIAADPGYGTLSGRVPDVLSPHDGQHDPRDFVLWKGGKPGEPAWRAPWGAGRPGWHVECSAMAAGYLGPEFDIHGGGQDLVFPHHENVVRPQELRYYLGQAHYRSQVEYSPAALRDAAAAYRRIERFAGHAGRALGAVASPPSPLPLSFTAVMDDDLGVPAALAAVHAAVRDGNYALGTGDLETAATCLAQVRAMLAVLGLDPLAPAWPAGDQGGRLPAMVDALVVLTLQQREAARARGDYASADFIRTTLEDAGVLVEDTPQGPRWELAR